MCRHSEKVVAILIMVTASVACGCGVQGDIHEYCGDAIAIVIGKPVSYSMSHKEASADFEVEQWLKPLATSQPASRPTELRLIGDSPYISGSTFHKLRKKGRFLVFVFPGNRTGGGRHGCIIEIDKNGKLPLFLPRMKTKPKTVDEIVAKIKRIVSKEYRTELINTLTNTNLKDQIRANAAEKLGYLRAREAWDELRKVGTGPGNDKSKATTRASLFALSRIDEAKAIPMCLSIVRNSRNATKVGAAAWILRWNPSSDPEALDILLSAARYWEDAASQMLQLLIPAICKLNKKTPEVEDLVMRCLKKGQGNTLIAAMRAASHLKIRNAIPAICQQIINKNSTHTVRDAAVSAVISLTGVEYRPCRVDCQMTANEARRLAADAFPKWRNALLKAPTFECYPEKRVVWASEKGEQIYILVGWQNKPNHPKPYSKTILLYRTNAKTTQQSGA